MVDTKKRQGDFSHSLRKRIFAMLILVVFCAGTVFASVSQAYAVTVYVDDVPYEVSTTEEIPKEIVKEAGFTVEDKDLLNLDGFTNVTEPTIKVYKEHTVTVAGNDGHAMSVTLAGTVEDAVIAAGFSIDEGDSINVARSAALVEGMEIFFLRKLNITFVENEEETTHVMAVPTVADAISEAGIVLGADDEVEPKADTPITSDITVTVYRVTYSQRITDEVVPFETTTEKTATMYTGESEVITAGQNGERTVTYNDKFVDGKLAVSKELESTIITEPVNEVERIGTKVQYSNITLRTNSVISELGTPDWIEFDSNDLPTNYSKIIEGRAASYSGGGTTSTGKKAQPGYIAVNPAHIPYGTKLWIVSLDGNYVYGYAIAADTGGFIYNDRFIVDLYMNTKSESIQWGARMVRMYVF